MSNKKYVIKEIFKTKNEKQKKELILYSIISFLEHEIIKEVNK